jgi:integrase
MGYWNGQACQDTEQLERERRPALEKSSKRITETVVAAATPKDKDSYIWDSQLAGLGLKITPAGKRVFIFKYRAPSDGRTRRLTIGTSSNISAPAARKHAERARDMLRQGIDPMDAKRSAKEAWSVSELAKHWLVHLEEKGRAAGTLVEYRRLLTRHILPALGRRKANDIAISDIVRLQSRVPGKYQSNRVVAVCGSMFTFAQRVEQAKLNPARLVERRSEKKRERYLSAAELARLGEALAAAVQEGVNPVAIGALRLLLLTGARRGEVLGLGWEDVDMDGARLRLSKFKGDTTAERATKDIPLSAPAMEVLAKAAEWRMKDNPFVFPAAREGRVQGRKGQFIGLPKVWYEIRERAGLDGVRLHDLRHSFASVAVSSGETLLVVGKVLGHTQPATTARYAHLHADPVRAAVESTAAKIQAMLEGRDAEIVPLRRDGGAT